MEDLKEDMGLSEFIGIVSADQKEPGKWSVKVPLHTKEDITLTINDCYSEFDAKERAYLYLVEKVYRGQNN